MGEICNVLGGKRIPKGMNFTNTVTSHPYIRVADFENLSVNTNSLLYIDDAVFEHIKKYTISKDDVFVSIAGTIGLVGVVPDSLDGANLTENAAKLVIKNPESIDKRFLAHMLNSESSQRQLAAETHAVGTPKLALSRLANVKIYLPSIDEQRKIIKEVEGYEQELLNAQQVMASCAARKRAVLDKYLV